MEKRMFRFGESSLAMIIPKRWTDKNKISASSPVSVSENSNGDLIISAREEPVREREEPVDSSISTAALGRLVGLHYMFGTTKLRLYFRNGLGRNRVRDVTEVIKNECPGFEIISHSPDDIVIEDFNNTKEADLWKIISRLRLIVKQEFREIRSGDMKALQESENLVNRFYMFGVRHINMLGVEESTRYFVILQMLEMVSDNLNILCQPNGLKNDKLLGKIEEQFDLCFVGLEGREDSIEKSMALREEIYNTAPSLKLDMLRVHAVQEIANEISRISEFGLYLKKQP